MNAVAAGRLHAVDLVRLVVVVGVIGVHATSLTTSARSADAGAVLTLLHVTREAFLLLSAFVLTYSLGQRVPAPRAFWRRRYPLVIVPYVVWTAIYAIADGRTSSPLTVTERFAVDLSDAGARYHLYFILVMLQLYAIFPWLLRALRAHSAHHRAIVAASAAFQLVITTGMHYGLRAPGLLGEWFRHPGLALPSYQFYVVAGVVAALHLDELTAFVQRHARALYVAAAAAATVAIASYELDLRALHMRPVGASDVFQPVVVVESVAFTAALYALGVWASDRIGARHRARLEAQSDVSFGVYLAHPLLLQAVIASSSAIGLRWLLPGSPSLPGLGLRLALLVPTAYVGTAIAIRIVRRTPVSLPLAGRPRSNVPRHSGGPHPARATPPALLRADL